jgi:hypothetical protein
MNTDVIVVKDLWYLFLSIHSNDVSRNSSYTPARDRSFIIGCEQSFALSISLTQWCSLMFLEYKIISFFSWSGWQAFSCGLCVKMNNKSRLQWGNNNLGGRQCFSRKWWSISMWEEIFSRDTERDGTEKTPSRRSLIYTTDGDFEKPTDLDMKTLNKISTACKNGLACELETVLKSWSKELL